MVDVEVVVVEVVVVVVVAIMMIIVMVVVMPVAVAMLLAIARRVGAGVPVITHEIHRSRAGVVAVAVVPPAVDAPTYRVRIRRNRSAADTPSMGQCCQVIPMYGRGAVCTTQSLISGST